jgi:hypothetical protein
MYELLAVASAKDLYLAAFLIMCAAIIIVIGEIRRY